MRKMPKLFAGHDLLTMPVGIFSGSMRISSAPSELAMIFQVAVDRFSWSLNQAFCSIPRIVRGSISLRGLGIVASRKLNVAGGLPPLAVRPASSAIITGSEKAPANAGS